MLREQLAKRGLSDRLVVVSIDLRSREQIRAFLDDLGLQGLQSFQTDPRRVAAMLKPSAYPVTYVLGPDGAVLSVHTGVEGWGDPDVQGRYLEARVSEKFLRS